jgi:hypothetical protein
VLAVCLIARHRFIGRVEGRAAEPGRVVLSAQAWAMSFPESNWCKSFAYGVSTKISKLAGHTVGVTGTTTSTCSLQIQNVRIISSHCLIAN